VANKGWNDTRRLVLAGTLVAQATLRVDLTSHPAPRITRRLEGRLPGGLYRAYYRELKGSVGARAFYEWFKRNNARQRKSLEDKGKETGKKRKVPEQFRKDMEERRRKREADGTARREMEPIPEYYTEKVKPWITWREARAYVAVTRRRRDTRC
jgi:hypothetical protein